MGQKVNPTCLRLHPENKHFDSCWFSEKQYGHSIHKNFNVEIYYNAILKQIQYPSASFLFEGAPRKSKFSVLFLNPALLRERAFKQFGNPNGRNRKVKRNPLFSTKKKTTFLYGLPEKKGEFLEFLPPHFLTSPFLQNLKKKHTVSDVFHKVKNEEKENRMPFFPLGQAKSRHSETGKGSNPSFYIKDVFSLEKTQKRVGGQTLFSPEKKQEDLEFKKNVCSSMLSFSILRYFVQRNFSENIFSASSRFLLLQAFFCFLKIQKKPQLHLSDVLTRERRPLFFVKQKTKVPTGREASFTHAETIKSDLFYNLQKSGIYTYHIESIISKSLKSSCSLFFFRAQNVAQNALFIAEEIVYQLERRNTFRQIKTKFLQELGNKPGIKGVRVTCVGRIGGRAKKAQRARGESFKMGQTSLHLFDSKVSFASKTALTPFGAVGVKVWICWK